MSATIPTSCIDCPHHKVVPDPDPTDWFCDDDEAVLCSKMENDEKATPWKFPDTLFSNKPVTVSCRPYQKRAETSPPPDWCPLRKKS